MSPTGVVLKLSLPQFFCELPLRPIASNIGTATYHLSKYLAELLFPLSESEYTIKNIKYFVEKIKKEHIPNNHLLVSFHVKSLFTNVPLDEMIEIILNRIYEKKRSYNWYDKKWNKRAFKPMYKKRPLCIPWQYLCSEWQCFNGFGIGTGFSQHIYGRIGAIGNTKTNWQDEVLDKVCWWYSLLYKDRFNWLCSEDVKWLS